MEPFSDFGRFWIPAAADRATGVLNFDGDKLSLELDGPLPESFFGDGEPARGLASQLATHPVIHGRLREHGDVTLFDSHGAHFGHRFPGSPTKWTSTHALAGVLSLSDQIDHLNAHFDYLTVWAGPPSLTEDVKDDAVDETILKLTPEVLDEADFGDATVRLYASWTGQYGGESVRVDRDCFFKVSASADSVDAFITRWVGPLQDLLIVLIGRPVRLTRLSASIKDASDRPLSAEVLYPAIQPGPSASPTLGSVRGYGTPALFSRSELPVELSDILSRWFAVRNELPDAISLLCSPFYAPFMYAQHRYTAMFQSAEAIARRRFEGSELERSAHSDRVESICAAATDAGISSEDVNWARRILQNRNDKPLADLIDELIGSTDAVGEMILDKSPDLARTVVKTRGAFTHPGQRREVPFTEQHYWQTEVLEWIVRARLLVELGIAPGVIAGLAKRRGRLPHVLDRLEG